MTEITLKAYGKINLTLYVGEKRQDGYHELSSVMQSVDLYDLVTVRKNMSGKITVDSNSKEIPLDETNIAVKAAKLMQDTFTLLSGYDIYVEKNIPVGGGMAGGSTNAAAVICAINELEGLGKSLTELCAIGKKIGADVPFCIYKKTALAEGIGEKLTAASGLKNCFVLLVNPNINISTGKVFSMMDEEAREKKSCKNMLAALKENSFADICNCLDNDMQKYTARLCPNIEEIIKKIKILGAGGTIMSGSGSTCFGLFSAPPNENELKEVLNGYWFKVVKPL